MCVSMRYATLFLAHFHPRVDQMKIYPHSVVPWTVTKMWLDKGKFKVNEWEATVVWLGVRVLVIRQR